MKTKLALTAGIIGSMLFQDDASASTNTHTVKKGDTLSSIAQKHDASLQTILNLNPQIKNPNLIFIGEKINLPDKTSGENKQTTKEKSEAQQDIESKIIKTASKYLGTPYQYGAPMTTTRKFDCSSFIKRVFKENGVTVPRVSRYQAKAGETISLAHAEKGDLLFFDTDYDGVINHVGIYVNEETMIHVSSSRGVRYTNHRSSYWTPRYVKAVKIID